ncbi:MAG: hypothetical protein H0X66_06615 [Verrucomicrobia bacterium]|nr:hypothetical protein [Verrucomicrobiota bacterium]
MKSSKIVGVIAQCTAVVLLTTALHTQAQNKPDKLWTATRMSTTTNFDVPECLLFDSARKGVFVSNISAKEDEYWSDNGKGFISLIDPDGTMKNLRWLDGNVENPLHSPKGMCVVKNWLYFTDNTRLLRCKIGKNSEVASAPEVVALPGTKKLNDLATDGKSVLVSDTELGKVFRIDPSGKVLEIPSPENVNGVTFHRGKIFAVSWGLHEVYELDPAGKNPPKPFGLASHFKNLDGIEVLDDGTFLVSDFMGNKVSTISPDRKTVRTLIEIESPADIGLDRKRGILYVPQFMKNQIVLFRLKKG